MRRNNDISRVSATLAVLAFAVSPMPAEENVRLDVRTPLDRFVKQKDPAYAWRLVSKSTTQAGEELMIRLTSQAWRAEGEVDRTLWKHWLRVCIPNNADPKTALLFISGGSNGGGTPTARHNLARKLALDTGSVVAELGMVPNQPLSLNGEQRGRKEDDLLAATWRMYLETRDPTWIAQLPMANSAVKAMDALQEVLPQEAPRLAIERFVVTGGSKRGWTTWLAAAVDDRVAAIAPLVIDVLNIDDSMRHHHAVYGFWSEALSDYQEQGIADKLPTHECQEILRIVDPYAYRDRYTMPKCLINASGDEFFLPDSSRFYYDDLPGEKHLCYVPNAGHSLEGSDALDTLTAFHYCIVHSIARPSVRCSLEDSVLTVECSTPPERAVLYRATNPRARDFRKPVVGDAFEATELDKNSAGEYVSQLTEPAEGFTASFAQFEFDVGAPTPFRVTSPVWVTPDIEPFAETAAE